MLYCERLVPCDDINHKESNCSQGTVSGVKYTQKIRPGSFLMESLWGKLIETNKRLQVSPAYCKGVKHKVAMTFFGK